MRYQTILEEELRCIGRAPTVLVECTADAESRRSFFDEKHRHRFAPAADFARLRSNAIEIGMDTIGDEHLGAVENIAGFGFARRGADALYVRARVRLGYRDSADHLTGDDLAHPSGFFRFGPGIEHAPRSNVGVTKSRDCNTGECRPPHFFFEHAASERVNG